MLNNWKQLILVCIIGYLPFQLNGESLDWLMNGGREIVFKSSLSRPLMVDASGYRGISFQIKGVNRTGILTFIDHDKDRWSALFTCKSTWSEVSIPFSKFQADAKSSEPHFDISDLRSYQIEVPETTGMECQIRNFRFTGSQGVYGPSICIDPVFAFYTTQSWPVLARKVKEQGFTAVDLIIIWNIPTIPEQQSIVEAFHGKGIACRLRLYPTTDGDAYQNHPEWRQKFLNGKSKFDWRTYLCPNSGYSKFIESKIENLCRSIPYDGVQLAEPWFEVRGGPYESNINRGYYSCLCDNCRAQFKKLTKVDPILLFDSTNSYYFQKPENKKLYESWVQFRVDSINSFSNRCYVAARKVNPGIKTTHMFLSDCRTESGKGREYQAMDLDAIVKTVKADMITIEDSWQDWTRLDLKPDFILDYGKCYVAQIKRLSPGMKIQTHLDIGSKKDTKRDYEFMREFSLYTHRAGFDSPSYYEYSVQKK